MGYGDNVHEVGLSRMLAGKEIEIFLSSVSDQNIYGYINGIEDFKVACTGTFSYAINQQIGMEGSSSRAFYGKIADLRIYATALPASDILALYENRIEIDSNQQIWCGNIVEREGQIELVKENVLYAPQVKEEENKLFDNDDYTWLEYIESDNTQYIDTGYKLKPSSAWELTFSCSRTITAQKIAGVWGSGGAGQNPTSEITTWPVNDEICIVIQHMPIDSLTHSGSIPIDTEKHVILLKEGWQSIDGIKLADSSIGQEAATSLLIGSRSKVGQAPNEFGYTKFYSCKIWEDDILIYNFIPVQTKEGFTGLFDLIGQRFYINQVGHAFIAGPILKVNKQLCASNFVEV